ncbi:unnamed protein product [Rhizoctonia solani]|uniref:Uncharacterized protein n=1 Tax=Rhizoctonia solani TaxID=456999 RepID=A0A8H3GPC6_9AGAM|nr:unnamed protein product [Rhizoctonia solani]
MPEDKQSSVPISAGAASYTAPTPVNTPLNAAPISRGFSHPNVPDISEDESEQQQGHDLMNKLQNLNIRPSGIVEVLPAPVARRVEGLKGYLLKFTPIFERRKAILLGDSEPTPEEITAGEAVSEKDDPEAAAAAKQEREDAEKNLSDEDKAIKGIPHFWLTVLRNHDGLSDLITEKDEAALEYLTDIRLVYLSQDTPGFKLIFDFAPNPYFENETLEKSYHYQDELGDTGDYIYDRAVGSEIKWKEEKDLTKAVEIKKQRNKTTNRTRLIRRSHSVPSFFNFFSPPAQPTAEQIENGEVDEDLLEELDEKLELDYQIGEDLKERIIPRAIDYFTGKAIEFDIAAIEDDDDYEDMEDDDFDESAVRQQKQKRLIHAKHIPTHFEPLLVIAHVHISPGPGINISGGQYALRTEVQKIRKEFKANKKKFRDENYLRAWLLPRTRAISSFLGREHWELFNQVEDDQIYEIKKLENQFRDDVVKRLEELGWEDDIRFASGREWLKLVFQRRSLTDRIWNNLYPKLQNLLETARIYRLKYLPEWRKEVIIELWTRKHLELRTQVAVHHRHMPIALNPASVRLVPPVSEALSWECIKQVIDAASTNPRICSTHLKTSCRLVGKWEVIHPLVEAWRRNVESKLAGRLRGDKVFESDSAHSTNQTWISGQPVSQDLDVLLRADSVFQFSDNIVRYFPGDFLEISSTPLQELVNTPVALPSSIEEARPFVLARKLAKSLLRYLGYPNATHLGLNARGERFVCGACVHHDSQFAIAYDWKELLNHFIAISSGLQSDNVLFDLDGSNFANLVRERHSLKVTESNALAPVYILSAEDAQKYTLKNWRPSLNKPWLHYKDKYLCLRCPQYVPSNLEYVITHIQQSHYVVIPQTHWDYENYEVYLRQSLEAVYTYVKN